MKRTALFLMLLGLLGPATLYGAVEVKPYGFILGNATYNTDALTDIPVLAPAEDTGEGNFLITSRQTRLGLKMKSDAQYSPSGMLEIDFFGLRGSGSNGGATQSAPRLRRAFVKIALSPKFDLLAGQEWVVFSPLNPTSLMHCSLPGMMASGNLWARLPQITGTIKPSDAVKIDIGIARPLAGDATMTPVEQADVLGRGERSGIPWVQGRIGYIGKGETKIAAGAGGFFGQLDCGEDVNKDTVTGTALGLAGDIEVQAKKVTLSAEAFYGQNLKTFFSNAGFKTKTVTQGDVVFPEEVNEIKSMGGWGEIKYAATEKFDVAASAGIESLDDEFLADGDVKQNLTVMGAGICKAVPDVKIGLELGYISTSRIDDDTATEDKETSDGTNMNVNLSFMFSF